MGGFRALPLLFFLAPLMAGAQVESDQYYPLSGDFAASHILVAWRGADKARPEVRRSKAEARAEAASLCAALLADPTRFEALAREHSDGVTAEVSGYLGGFPKGRMDRPFEAALRKLAEGEITPEPVRTAFGYHIIRRESLLVKRYAARMLLLSHTDAADPRGLKDEAPGRNRTRSGSLALLAQLRQGLSEEQFRETAEKHSDLNKVFLGVFREGDGPFTDRVIAQLKNMTYGQISSPLDWDVGYVLLQRIKVMRRSGSRIFIGHYDSEHASLDVTRNRQEAHELATRLYGELQSEPGRFEKLAKAHSDDPGAANGGKMAAWYVGYQDFAVEEAFGALAPGQISAPIETADGFFLMRNDAEAP